MKPISFWAAVYSAYNIGFVFDLSAGSGAQAIAAAQVGIGYRGVCANEKHMKWLNSLLEKAILAVEADSKTGKWQDQEYAAKLTMYFGTAVAEAKRMLREEEPGNSVEDHEDSSSDE